MAYFSSIVLLGLAASQSSVNAHGQGDTTTYFDSVVFLTMFLLAGMCNRFIKGLLLIVKLQADTWKHIARVIPRMPSRVLENYGHLKPWYSQPSLHPNCLTDHPKTPTLKKEIWRLMISRG